MNISSFNFSLADRSIILACVCYSHVAMPHLNDKLSLFYTADCFKILVP